MNSMSIAKHCSMLMKDSEHSGPMTTTALDRLMLECAVMPPKTVLHASTNEISIKTGIEIEQVQVKEQEQKQAQSLARTSAATLLALASNTLFSVTEIGRSEMRLTVSALPAETRRALGLIDGVKTVHELSLKLRAGEVEKILRELEQEKFIERLPVDSEAASHSNAATVPSPERLAAIKRAIMSDLRARLGRPADFVLRDVLGTIEQCDSAIELRQALRDAGDVLLVELGETGVRQHLRAVGKNVMELIAQKT